MYPPKNIIIVFISHLCLQKSADKYVRKDDNVGKNTKKILPARTMVGRENQLINLAVNLAEEKLKNGTASSQIITTLLQLATTKYQLENEKLRSELRVAEAKIKSLEAQETSKDLYAEAIMAFKQYSGLEDDEEFDNYEEGY